ncbi:MAG: T9SS type A sorting domain-containing protein [Bacteroidetes bacterium]|nr:T9SS type A sorting domain-containing protein [Bacteroidota bacterium]
MKRAIIFMLFTYCFFRGVSQQGYIADKMEVMSQLQGYSTYTYSNKYYSFATFYQNSIGREYVVFNSLENIYFVDITDPKLPVKMDSITSIFSEPFKNLYVHKNYCYFFDVYDNVYIYDKTFFPSSLLFLGMYQTPASIYSRIFSNNLMYSIKSGTNIIVTNISSPQNFVVLDSLSKDIPALSSVNSISMQNDTLYASCGNKGLFMLHFDTLLNKFSAIDSVPNTNNQNTFYNHFVLNNILIKTQYPYTLEDEIFLSKNGLYIFNNNALFLPGGGKKYFCALNEKWVISYNNMGLFLYSIDEPLKPVKLGSFSTYNSNSGSSTAITKCTSNFNGKYLIALNSVNGIYILDPTEAVKLKEKEISLKYDLLVYPSPANSGFTVQLKRDYPTTLSLISLNGISLYKKTYNGNINDFINTTNISEGAYVLKIDGNEGQLSRKIIIKH